MGLDSNNLKILLRLKAEGYVSGKLLTLGRQYLYLEKSLLKTCLQRYNYPYSDDFVDKLLTTDGGYADSFFKEIINCQPQSIDYSNYEGVTYTHDMNLPVSEDLCGQFDIVFDGGTLEHIFNFPVAVSNCMRMIKTKGYYMGVSPTNNFCGHGFYQYSPELWFRIFSKDNGFQILKTYIYEDRPGSTYYEIEDPAAIGDRLGIINDVPVYQFILAQKQLDRIPFTEGFPQQSDYKIAWSDVTRSSLKTQVFTGEIKGRPGIITHSKQIIFRILRRLGLVPITKPEHYLDKKFIKSKTEL